MIFFCFVLFGHFKINLSNSELYFITEFNIIIGSSQRRVLVDTQINSLKFIKFLLKSIKNRKKKPSKISSLGGHF